MKPIAQTFYVNEPDNGVAGIYLTSLELFFASKSDSLGITVEIRDTDNGNPTKYVLPLGRTKLAAADVKISDDASVSTYVPFNAPLFLHSGTSYAIVIIPDGGNPDYTIWTADIIGTKDAPAIDVTTGSPIKTNNDTGTLFLSSNDLQFTAVQTEDIKFKLYRADFTATSGVAAFTSKRSDYIMGKEKIGSFYPRERVVVSNNNYSFARLIMSSNTGAFTVGEKIFQANSTGSNVATAVIATANQTNLKLTNCVGTFVTSYQVKGFVSNANAVITSVYDSVITTAGSNTITVPFTNTFSSATNQLIFVGANDRSTIQVGTVTEIIDGTTLRIRANARFSDGNCLFGAIRGGAGGLGGAELLYGGIKIEDDPINPNVVKFIVDNVTSNTTVNFSNSRGKYIIGLVSGASIKVTSVYNSSYTAIVPQFADIAPPQTNTSWSFVGASGPNKTMDSEPIPLTNNVEKELYDYPRSLMSRSNEYNALPPGRKGDTTIQVYSAMTTSNNKISPYIDVGASRMATFTSNQIVPKEKLYGFKMVVEDNPFTIGDYIMQKNDSTGHVSGRGYVDNVTPNLIVITDVTGFFTANSSYDLLKTDDYSVNTIAQEYSYFSENYNANYTGTSRYISKNVVLAEGQDAEDIRVFLTAYRPATTDFLVYARFQNREDVQKFDSKYWTKLVEISSPSMLSSTANVDDFLELEYGLPRSVELFANSCTCNSTSNWITISSSEQINQNDIIYLKDIESTKFFTGKIIRINAADTTKVRLEETPPFDIANAAFGVIPDLIDKRQAFVFSDNSNIVRYMNNKYAIFDSYKSFAIKIVPVSEGTAVFPRAKDMRAIALQV